MSRLPSLRAMSFAAVIIWPDHEYSAVLPSAKLTCVRLPSEYVYVTVSNASVPEPR